MKIDGFPTTDYNVNIPNEVQTKSINAQSLSDVVSFGSSVMGFFGEDMNNTSVLGESDDAMEALKSKATVLKDNLTAIFNKMDSGMVVSMNEDGIDVNNTEAKELVTVVEQIQIKLATYCEDFQATVDIDASKVSEVIGQGAAAYEISQKMLQEGIQPTKENVSEALEAYNIASEFNKELSNDTKAFLLKNNMKPSIKNVYIAEHAGTSTGAVKELSQKEWQDILPQVEKIIAKADLPQGEQSQKLAKWLVDREIPLNEESLNKLAELNDVSENFNKEFIMDRIIATMKEGMKGNNTLITGESLPWEEAVSAIETVNFATPSIVMWWSHSELSYTLDGLREAENLNIEETPVVEDEKYVKATRQLWEVRLMMTINAGRALEKNGIQINTLEISQLVEKLRGYEVSRLNEKLDQNDMLYTTEDVKRANDVLFEFMSLRKAPAVTLGKVVQENVVASVNNIKAYVPDIMQKLANAGKAYEALSTEIRQDLGDSVGKAIKASTGDILDGMGLKHSKDNERAVRILAYNEMDITEEKIDKVKAMDASVNTLFERLNPECTLKMLQEGINPLEMPVEELSEYLLNMQQALRPKEEKFSEFLYRLDKKGEISSEDREKFIGVYSLVNRFNKDGMNAIGSLINQGLELNMGNLMTAYFSRKDKGMELVADDVTPTVHMDDKVTYYKNLFGRAAEKLTPEILEEMEQDFVDMAPEEFVEKIIENEPDYQQLVDKQRRDFEKATGFTNDVYKFVTDNHITGSLNNVIAAGEFLNDEKKTFTDYNSETGEDFGEAVLKVLENKEELLKEYDKLVDNTRKLLEEATLTKNSYVDMEALRMMGNKVNMIQALSRQNYFCIPFSGENTDGIIHLKVIESDNEQGIFNIKFNLRDGSKVSIEGKVEGDTLRANILCQNESAAELFEGEVSFVSEALKENGFNNVSIRIGKADNHPQGGSLSKEAVSTQLIYKAAKIFITNLAK